MAEQSKFSGALAKLNQRPADTEADENPPAVEIVNGGKGRPPGKRSDPEYQPTTVLLRKQTKRAANRRLEDIGSDKDLSDLIEELLSNWLKQTA